MAINTMFLALPQLSAGAIMGLPDDARFEALDRARIMREAFQADNPREYLAQAAREHAARGRGWSFKRLESQYYMLRNGADPSEVLVNSAKERGNKSRWMTPAVIARWHELCQLHFRSYKSAYIELVADYKTGKMVGDVDWRAVWREHPDLHLDPIPQTIVRNMPLPDGWSYCNFMRNKPRRIEELAARIGKMAARELALPVRTTRADLEPGMQYTFDDLDHDCEVIVEGELKPVRVIELACLDWASAYKPAFGLKPARVDQLTKKKEDIKGRDMRFLVAHMLCNVGFHPDGCTLLVENATAAIESELQAVLQAKEYCRPDGTPLIRVSRSGIDRGTAHPGQWGGLAKGNPRHKSALESWNNLSHNRLDDLPAQTGSLSRVNMPEELPAMQKVANKMLLAGMVLTPELAKRLEFPQMDFQLFSDIVHERYHQIHATHDHALEGWEKRMERQWRCGITDHWHSEESWHRLPEEMRAKIAPILEMEGNTRVARMSREQVWTRGLQKLVRLPKSAIALICGRDLAESRPCPSMAEVVFVDKDLDPAPMAYRLSTCVNERGERVLLQEGTMYLWMINPFDTRNVFVMTVAGAYVGMCERSKVANRADLEELGRQIGIARKDFNEALKPLAVRGAAAARKQLAQLRRNTALLRSASPVTPALPESTTPAPAAPEVDEAAIDAALAMIEESMDIKEG